MTPAHASTAPRLSERPRPAAGHPLVWGLCVRELHDRFWAAKGVQVVRRGVSPPDEKGPRLSLLIEPDDLVIFPLSPIARRFNWLKPRLMRLRIVHRDDRDFDEAVDADDSGRFLGVRRVYRPRTRSTQRVWLTGDRRVAALWAEASTRPIGREAMRRAAGPDGALPQTCHGPTLDATDEAESGECAAWLLGHWARPAAVIDGVYEFQPGVWLHESVRVPPGARFVGPLWIGAGVRLEPGEIVVGPAILPDESPVPPARAVDWESLLLDARLLPRWNRRSYGRPGKRLFDIVFSLAVLAATLPLYPFIVLAIVLEDGWPVFFAHRRQTLGGREFPCLKFRTMRRDAEALKAQLQARNICDGPQFYIEDDPRVLRVGRFLRRFHLDELPQFWNVLAGHMSVVGPRPSPDRENQFCPAWREARLSVRPGVTGLWQVRRTRAPETDFQEWIRYDLEYVQTQGWTLDLWIIISTVLRLFRREGADA